MSDAKSGPFQDSDTTCLTSNLRSVSLLCLRALAQAAAPGEQAAHAVLQRAVVAERLSGLLAQRERIQEALERSLLGDSSAGGGGGVEAEGVPPAELGIDASVVSDSAAIPGVGVEGEGERRSVSRAAAAAAAKLVEDDALDAELSARAGGGGGGFVETERDRLICTVRPEAPMACSVL